MIDKNLTVYKIMKFVSLAKLLIPKGFRLQFLFLRLKLTSRLDVEMKALRKERPSCRRAIDVGANVGIYSYYFSTFSESVDSFEPVKQISSLLEAYALRCKKVKLHNVGLSNRVGKFNIYYPYTISTREPNWGLASLTNPCIDCGVLSVDVRRLDDYKFTNVDIIKIDVEGHEMDVVLGAVETIRRDRPILLVEIEQRHLKRPISDVFDYIIKLGYVGGFYRGGRFTPLNEFSYERDQGAYLKNVYSRGYINNFIFKPVDQSLD